MYFLLIQKIVLLFNFTRESIVLTAFNVFLLFTRLLLKEKNIRASLAELIAPK